MFIYKQPVAGKPGHFRIQLCVSKRQNGKITRHVVRHFGITKTEEDTERLTRFVLSELDREIARKNNFDPLFDTGNSLLSAKTQESEQKYPALNELKEKSRHIEGFKDVYGALYDDLFGSLFSTNEDLILKEVVLARIARPSSKRRTQEILERNMGFSTSLTSIYRMMDSLHEKNDEVLKRTFQQTCSIFNNKLDLLFFDVTTLYFESFSDDELRKFGYSKDQKYHVTQVVLALATTSSGLPIGYKLFPGNTAETTTLLQCIDEWSKLLEIGKVIFVADSAMCTFGNLYALQNREIEFVVCAKIKTFKADIKEGILSDKDRIYRKNDDENIKWHKDMSHQMSQKKLSIQGRLIVTYSTSRATKDAGDRNRIIEKLQTKLGKIDLTEKTVTKKSSAKKLISNSGYLKYTNIEDKKVANIDDEKIKQDALWDGLHALFTNSTKSAQEILNTYRGLWVIEESFRIQKNDLSMRPIYHFKSDRIYTHICLCYIAFSLIRHLQFRLEKNGLSLSPERIRTELAGVEVSIYQDKNGKQYKMPSNISPVAKQIYDCLDMKRKTMVSEILV